MKIARIALPGAICILHPDSCCMREICSPPLPITSKKKKKLLMKDCKVCFDYMFKALKIRLLTKSNHSIWNFVFFSNYRPANKKEQKLTFSF